MPLSLKPKAALIPFSFDHSGDEKAKGISFKSFPYREAESEAIACFANGELYLEKLIQSPKHIEFQILADKKGNIVHLGERDCSIQRKNQKLIEETPSRALTDELRKSMGDAAVKAARVGSSSKMRWYSSG